MAIADACRINLLVEDRVIVEITKVDERLSVDQARVLTCLRFTDTGLGLPLNVHAAPLTSVIRRVVNGLSE